MVELKFDQPSWVRLQLCEIKYCRLGGARTHTKKISSWSWSKKASGSSVMTGLSEPHAQEVVFLIGSGMYIPELTEVKFM